MAKASALLCSVFGCAWMQRVLLLLAVGAITLGGAAPLEQPSARTAAGSYRRQAPALDLGQSATQLSDGRWLIAGGQADPRGLLLVDQNTGARARLSLQL